MTSITDYPMLSERLRGWLKCLHHRVTMPDVWDRGGHPSSSLSGCSSVAHHGGSGKALVQQSSSVGVLLGVRSTRYCAIPRKDARHP